MQGGAAPLAYFASFTVTLKGRLPAMVYLSSPRPRIAVQETRMSSISPTASVSSQPPVAYTPPVDKERAQEDAKAAEQKAAKVADLSATAVKAQAVKEAGKGAVLDIQA